MKKIAVTAIVVTLICVIIIAGCTSQEPTLTNSPLKDDVTIMTTTSTPTVNVTPMYTNERWASNERWACETKENVERAAEEGMKWLAL
ncbi:MAG: hypothetical protein A4E35_00235 [Methanoregula sp. PtaU1.Bin051]|nr:MAG: hypothetical protein A4E35_00235 [Methanoregula sp. PtaU1.Bin051]